VGPLLAALLVVALLLVPAGWRLAARRSRSAAARAGGPGAAGAAWAELVAESTDRGVPVPPTDTVRAAARRLVREHRLDAEAQDGLRAVVTAVEADWYGGEPPEPGRLAQPWPPSGRRGGGQPAAVEPAAPTGVGAGGPAGGAPPRPRGTGRRPERHRRGGPELIRAAARGGREIDRAGSDPGAPGPVSPARTAGGSAPPCGR
jgi:hypothetical protein